MPEISKSSQSLRIETYRIFLKLHKLFQDLNREEFRAYDLSTPQYAILVHASEEGVPLSQISEEMLADNSNMTRLVDRLEARGLVRRAAAPHDRRVTLVQLTPAGAELIAELRPRHRALIEERMGHADNAQLIALYEALETIYTGLKQTQQQP